MLKIWSIHLLKKCFHLQTKNFVSCQKDLGVCFNPDKMCCARNFTVIVLIKAKFVWVCNIVKKMLTTTFKSRTRPHAYHTNCCKCMKDGNPFPEVISVGWIENSLCLGNNLVLRSKRTCLLLLWEEEQSLLRSIFEWGDVVTNTTTTHTTQQWRCLLLTTINTIIATKCCLCIHWQWRLSAHLTSSQLVYFSNKQTHLKVLSLRILE